MTYLRAISWRERAVIGSLRAINLKVRAIMTNLRADEHFPHPNPAQHLV